MTTVLARRHWIPPLGLIAGHLGHGASWAFLFTIAGALDRGATLDALAWVHLVALGWLTLIALSVLLHVIPAFTGNAWRGESIARIALAAYAFSAAGLIASFAMHAVRLLPVFGGLVAMSVLAYLIPAAATLFVPPPAERVERAIARALGTTLAFLAAGVALGTFLTVALRTAPAHAALLAPVHADLALAGWLSLLVIGVSTRTLRPITRNPVRMPALHIAVGTTAVLGVLATAAGLALAQQLVLAIGAGVLALAAALYLAQVTIVLAGARNPHGPPQAFVAASIGWLALAVGLGCAIAQGRGSGSALIFLLLAGWLGQMVNGHLHHIGIRVLATVARGDDDETEPQELLDGRLSWTAFAAFQLAVGAGTYAALTGVQTAGELAAACGLAGWLAMTLNIAGAWRNARRTVTA